MNIGITLGGGLAKGAFQFGFLKAFLNHIPKEDIKIVSCSSIGLINAYGLCANKMDEVEAIWRSVDYDNIFEVIKDCWFHKFVKKTFNKLIQSRDKLDIPFYATITYTPLFLPIILVGRYYLLKGSYNKRWKKFACASVSFPIISGVPRFYKGLPTIDGGSTDNIPIYPLMENHDLDLILGIHFDSKYILKKSWRNSKTIVLDLDASLGNSLRKSSFNFSTKVLNKMLDDGYEYGERICQKIFESGYGNIEGIRKSVADLYDQEFEERMKNGTIDRLITLLNGYAQIFRGKHSIKPLIKPAKKKKVKKEKKVK